jgi:hypothetical protein
MSKSDKQVDFKDLVTHDAIALVTNTAVVARDSGHPVKVAVANYQGSWGILVWMPGYHMVNGAVVAIDSATSGNTAGQQ